MAVTRERLRLLLELREKKAQAKAAHDEAKEESDNLEFELRAEMEDSGQESVTFDLGEPFGRYTFSISETIYADVVDAEAFRRWAEENARGEQLIRPEVRKQQANELVRAARDRREPLPPGLAVRPVESISVRKKPTRKRSG